MNKSIYENNLTKETSPYLLQHINNSVNWYPWGEEAIEKARSKKTDIAFHWLFRLSLVSCDGA